MIVLFHLTLKEKESGSDFQFYNECHYFSIHDIGVLKIRDYY